MRFRFRKQSIGIKIVVAATAVLVLSQFALHIALASDSAQQYQSQQNNSAQVYYCLAMLIVAIPLAIWGRNKVRSGTDAAGYFNATINVAQPPDSITKYINKNYDRSSKGGRDWSKKWTTKNPPKVQLSTWYPRYWENCLFMILMGIIPYLILREFIGGRSEKVFVDVAPGENGGSVVKLSSEGKVGYEEAWKLSEALKQL
jgi:hypothetical protein